MSTAPWPPAQPTNAAAPRSWSTVAVAALILAGLGLVFAFASGLGLPFALAGVVCSAIAMRRDPAARPWPAVALATSIVAALIAAVLVVIAVVTWAPLVPALLFG